MEEKADSTQAGVQAAVAEPCCRVPGVESHTFWPWEGPQQVRRMQLPWVLSGPPILVYRDSDVFWGAAFLCRILSSFPLYEANRGHLSYF